MNRPCLIKYLVIIGMMLGYSADAAELKPFKTSRLVQADVSGTESISLQHTQPVVSNSADSISVDGDLGDWAALTSFSLDPADVVDGGGLDWLQAWMAHDGTYLYLAIESDGVNSIWDQAIFIDSDGNSATGYRGDLLFGADYLLQGAFAYRYSGIDDSWDWVFSEEMSAVAENGNAEFRVSRAALGDPEILKIGFIAKGEAGTSRSVDLYPDGLYDVSSSERYFQYDATAPINTAPVMNDHSVRVAAGESAAMVLQASDANADQLSWIIVTPPAHGTLQGAAPQLSYLPDSNYQGADSFEVSVSDGALSSDVATVSVTVTSPGFKPELSNPLPPLDASGLVGAIVVDGDTSDWENSGIFWFMPDSTEGTSSRNPVDLTRAAMAHDEGFFYLAAITSPVSPENLNDHVISAYFDTDANAATGFRGEFNIGADYLLQGNTLFQYAGGGLNWEWQAAGSANNTSTETSQEVSFSRAQIGDPRRLHMVLIGDNYAYGGATDDHYPDGAHNRNDDTRYLIYTTAVAAQSEPDIGAVRDSLTAPVSGRLERMQNAQTLKTAESTPKQGGGAVSALLLPLLALSMRRRRWCCPKLLSLPLAG